MFDFGLTEELELSVRTARSFSERYLVPDLRQAEAARGPSAAARAAFAETGLGELALQGLGARGRVLVGEELAAADAGAAFALDGFGLATDVLLALGAEPPPGDPGGRALVVTAADGAFESSAAGVSGHVPWVPADRVDLLIVLHEAYAQVLAPPFELERLHGSGLRAAGASAIQLREHPIAHYVADPARTAAALGRARLYVAASLVGVLRQACEYSRRYALDRVAFGRPIAHHQALAFLIVDLHSAVSGARLLLHDAAFRADHGLPFEAVAASAFAEAVEASRSIGPGCVQILGGHGFMQDHPVEKYMRESRALGLMLGGIDLAREHAGRALCDASLPFELSALEEDA